jgi:Dolichyl-phosphate-mannose-protein mannosyltransferase
MSRDIARSPGTHVALLLSSAAAYLYCNLFLLPDTPIWQSDDQAYFWMHAQRMLNGERPYIEFFQYTPPGTDLFFLALFKAFGARIWVLNAAVIALGVSLCWICWRGARQFVEPRLAALAAAIYLVFIFGKPLNATHHWFSVLMLMCAVVLILPERTGKRLAGAGALLAFAAFFTHTHGIVALAAFVIFLVAEQVWQQTPRRELVARLALLAAGFVGTALALNSYFIATAGLPRLWAQQVTYARRYSVQGFSIPNLGLPAPLVWHNAFTLAQPMLMYVLLPIVYLVCLFAKGPRAAEPQERQRVQLLSLVGLLLFAEVALSPNWLRVYAVSMPGVILCLWLGAKLGERIAQRLPYARRMVIPLIVAGVLSLAAAQVWSRHHRPSVIADLPGGVAAVPAAQYQEVDWIAKHTQPGEFLFQAAWPGLYVPLGLRNPLFLDAAGTDEETRPEEIDLAIRQLDEKAVRYVVWSQRLDAVRPGHAEEYHLEPLRRYLRERYTLVKSFANADELWQRR